MINIFNIISSYSNFTNNEICMLSKSYDLDITQITSNEYYDVNCLCIFQKGIVITNVKIKNYDFLKFIKVNKNIKKIKLYVPFNKIIFEKFPKLESIEFIRDGSLGKYGNNISEKKYNNDICYQNITLKEVILYKQITSYQLNYFFNYVSFIDKLIFRGGMFHNYSFFHEDSLSSTRLVKIKEIYFNFYYPHDLNYIEIISKIWIINYLSIDDLYIVSINTNLQKINVEKIYVNNISLSNYARKRNKLSINIRENQKIILNNNYAVINNICYEINKI